MRMHVCARMCRRAAEPAASCSTRATASAAPDARTVRPVREDETDDGTARRRGAPGGPVLARCHGREPRYCCRPIARQRTRLRGYYRAKGPPCLRGAAGSCSSGLHYSRHLYPQSRSPWIQFHQTLRCKTVIDTYEYISRSSGMSGRDFSLLLF